MTHGMSVERQDGTAPIAPAQLKELSVRSNLPGLVRAASHYGAIAILGGVIHLVSLRHGPAWAAPLIMLQAYLVAFLFMPVHEAAHKTVFRNRLMNLALGHLSGLMVALPYEYYSLFHWDHHRFTQDPERDPELLTGSVPLSDSRLAVAYTGVVQLVRRIRLLYRHALTGRVTAPWIPVGKRGLVVAEARSYALVYLVLLGGSIALSSSALLWTWLVPLFAGQIFLRPYLYAEHTGCGRTRSAYENTRTTKTNMLMHWFAWNMPHHVEHHAYPSVPFHALPRLHALVGGRILHRGNGYLAVLRETWAWHRGEGRSGA